MEVATRLFLSSPDSLVSIGPDLFNRVPLTKRGKPLREFTETAKAIHHARRRLRRKAEILAKTEYRCVYCDKFLLMDIGTLLDATIDHFVPSIAGGADASENMFGCCRACNTLKGGAVVSTLQEARELIRRRRVRYRCVYTKCCVGLAVESLRRDTITGIRKLIRHWRRRLWLRLIGGAA